MKYSNYDPNMSDGKTLAEYIDEISKGKLSKTEIYEIEQIIELANYINLFVQTEVIVFDCMILK